MCARAVARNLAEVPCSNYYLDAGGEMRCSTPTANFRNTNAQTAATHPVARTTKGTSI